MELENADYRKTNLYIFNQERRQNINYEDLSELAYCREDKI